MLKNQLSDQVIAIESLKSPFKYLISNHSNHALDI